MASVHWVWLYRLDALTCSLEVSDQCEMCQSPSRSSTSNNQTTIQPPSFYTLVQSWPPNWRGHTLHIFAAAIGRHSTKRHFYEKNEKNKNSSNFLANTKHETQQRSRASWTCSSNLITTNLPIYTYCGVFSNKTAVSVITPVIVLKKSHGNCAWPYSLSFTRQ